VFARTLDFVKQNWKKELPVPKERMENKTQELRPSRIPSDFDGLPE
jgi:ATP-dependent RNA helicase DDX3X